MKIVTVLLAVFSVSLLGGCLEKKDTASTPSTIKIEKAYAFATMPGQATGAAFMIIKNIADSEDTLTDASSSVANITELHENLIDPDDNTMMMRKVKTITVPAQKEISLQPTGHHVMLIKLKEPLTLGSKFPVELTFTNAGEISVDVEVIQPGSKPAGH